MCDIQSKLVAWMDGELPVRKVVEVKRHLRSCGECQKKVALYRQTSEEFALYCGASVNTTKQEASRWAVILAGTVAAAAALFAVAPWRRIDPPPAVPPKVITTAAPAPAKESAPQRPVRKSRAIRVTEKRTVEWQVAEAAVQIAIPAEAMFPPGTVPEGLRVIAELRIAPDGSVDQLLLRP